MNFPKVAAHGQSYLKGFRPGFKPHILGQGPKSAPIAKCYIKETDLVNTQVAADGKTIESMIARTVGYPLARHEDPVTRVTMVLSTKPEFKDIKEGEVIPEYDVVFTYDENEVVTAVDLKLRVAP